MLKTQSQNLCQTTKIHPKVLHALANLATEAENDSDKKKTETSYVVCIHTPVRKESFMEKENQKQEAPKM